MVEERLADVILPKVGGLRRTAWSAVNQTGRTVTWLDICWGLVVGEVAATQAWVEQPPWVAVRV